MKNSNSDPDESINIRYVLTEFRERSLRYVEGNLAKLVYLSSCRDYNSGRYRHDGLAARFSEEMVHEALALCHRDLFEQMIQTPLAEWVEELRRYFTGTDPEAARIWRELRPYQIAVPLGTTALAAELFMSNLKIALEILESERRAD
jgi:hypothetical protein